MVALRAYHSFCADVSAAGIQCPHCTLLELHLREPTPNPIGFVDWDGTVSKFKRNQVGVVLHQDYFKDILEGNLSLEAHFLEKIERQRCNLRFESALIFPESYTDFISWEMLDLEISQSLCRNYRILDDEKVKKLLVDMKSFIRKKVKI